MPINHLESNISTKYRIRNLKEVKQKESSLNFCASNSLQKDRFEQNNLSNINPIELKEKLEQTKSQQGYIGKLWDGFKNLTTIGASSKEAQKAIENYEKGIISTEELNKAVDGYIEGQKMVSDVVADIASGCLSILAFTLVIPTGGASLAIGLGASTITGAIVKTAIKASEKSAGKQKYTTKDLIYDGATGAINGLLGPITNGIGNTLTKTIATKLGITVLKEGTQQAGKQTILQGAKSVILNQTDDIISGSIGKKLLAQSAGMAADGALGGASDNMVRAALEGKDVLQAGADGFVGGLIMAPIIGLGMKGASSGAKAINNKITMAKVLPDGLATKFKQGSIGDCALLSTIDGLMNNPATAKTFKKSITKTIFGDYHVQIGNNVVKVAKSSLSDEALSDTVGIKLFEQAYKQLYGSIDGGFAEIVAKQFGLNPVHITSDLINDELLDKLAKNQNNSVLSFGTLVDSNGAITNTNGSRHYFTIKNINPKTKSATLTSPIDSSKTIELSYEQIKNLAISIDGGTIKNLDLPNVLREIDDEAFNGIKTTWGEIDIKNREVPSYKNEKQIRKRVYFKPDNDVGYLQYYDVCRILAPENQEFFIDGDKKLSIELANSARYNAMDFELTNISDRIDDAIKALKAIFKDVFNEEIKLSQDMLLLPKQAYDASKKARKEIYSILDKQTSALKATYKNSTGKELVLDKDVYKRIQALKKALEELEGTNTPAQELENFKVTFEKLNKLKEIEKYCSILQDSAFDYRKTDERLANFSLHPERIDAEYVSSTIRDRNNIGGKKTILLHSQKEKMFLLGETTASGANITEASLSEKNRIYLTHQEFMDCINLIKKYDFIDPIKIEDKYVDGERFISTKGFNDGEYGSLHSLHRLIQNFGLDENGRLDLNRLKSTLDLINDRLYKDFRKNSSLFSNTGKQTTDAQAGLLISRGKSSGGKTTILFKENNDPNAKNIITAIFDSNGYLYTIYKQDIEGTRDFIPFNTVGI